MNIEQGISNDEVKNRAPARDFRVNARFAWHGLLPNGPKIRTISPQGGEVRSLRLI
jgi:hypothetical protein